MWDAIEISHIGTIQMKESKVHTFMSQYELLKINDGESIKDIVQRFITIINHLSIIDRKFKNVDLIHKVFHSLAIIKWQLNITAIKCP